MKRKILFIIVILIMFIGTIQIFAQTAEVEKELSKKLDIPSTFEFDENSTFQGLLDRLKKDFDIEAEWDTKNNGALGLTLDSPLVREPVRYHGIKIRSALRLILSELDLTYQIKDGKLLITSEDAAKNVNSIKVGMWNRDDIMPLDIKIDANPFENEEEQSAERPSGGGSVEFNEILEITETIQGDSKPRASVYLSDSEEIRQLQEKLKVRTSLNLDENDTFENLFRILREQYNIQAHIDPAGAGALGITASSPIVRESFNLENVPLRRLLRLILDEQDLTFVIDDGFLLITSEEDAKKHMKIRVYNVADLISPSCFKWMPVFGPCFGGLQWIYHLELKGHADFSEIMDMIEMLVSADTWSSNGRDGEMMEYHNGLCLVVLQTDEVHEQLEQLFEQLRKQVEQQKSKIVQPCAKPKKKQTCGQNYIDASKGSGMF